MLLSENRTCRPLFDKKLHPQIDGEILNTGEKSILQ